jgi:hypothetical protein
MSNSPLALVRDYGSLGNGVAVFGGSPGLQAGEDIVN